MRGFAGQAARPVFHHVEYLMILPDFARFFPKIHLNSSIFEQEI